MALYEDYGEDCKDCPKSNLEKLIENAFSQLKNNNVNSHVINYYCRSK